MRDRSRRLRASPSIKSYWLRCASSAKVHQVSASQIEAVAKLGHRRDSRARTHNLHEGGMNLLPRLREVEGQSANSVAVCGEFDGEVACGARVKEDALGLLPTGFAGLLTQVSEELIEIAEGSLAVP